MLLSKKIELLRDIVCKYFSIDIKTLNARSRKRISVEPKQIIIYLASTYGKEFGMSGTEIASLFISEGNENPYEHSIVTYTKKHINDLMDANEKLSNGIYVKKTIEDIWGEYTRIMIGFDNSGLKKYLNKSVILKYKNNGEKTNLTCQITSLGSEAFLVEKEELKVPLTYSQIINIDIVKNVNN